ncbi:hypothetical protein RND81_14G232400 [Saponaria officinalis]|uniref:RING-type domain-containing protein n=1 Tax=Saponaria officinalis TaxID=3572 RepID=A0AAW1GSR8_SAPOF
MATVLFYTCIYSPFLRIKGILKNILGFLICMHHHHVECAYCSKGIDSIQKTSYIDLPMSTYKDLKSHEFCNDNDNEDDEPCSVCLVEFEGEDLVSKLSKCGHVFHMTCIDKWVDRNQFTCPLCRTSFLNLHETSSYVSCK